MSSISLDAYIWASQKLAFIWRWSLTRRIRLGKETVESKAEKLALSFPNRSPGPLIWGHAVGVGESLALAGLFARIAEKWPEAHFLITTTARSSGLALQKNGLPPRCTHQFSPVDVPEVVDRFLKYWRPNLAIWCEMDLWPALINATTQNNIPHVLVNARLSMHALKKRRWGRWIYQTILPSFNAIWVQNQQSQDSLIALGAKVDQITITGTIKNFAPPLSSNVLELHSWLKAAKNRPTWILASSHPGEETIALNAHEEVLRHRPNALLIIAPRAPARGPDIAKICPTGSTLRSAKGLVCDAVSVYIADTIGEMGLWYRVAPIALMGGSFAPVGGHNPHEPVALGCSVLHGPHVWNFSESYADLDEQGVALQVADSKTIAQTVLALWAQPTAIPNNNWTEKESLVASLIALAQR